MIPTPTSWCPPGLSAPKWREPNRFGNSRLGILRGPGQFNTDLSLVKLLALSWPREGANLEFRTEFFNVFNHPSFRIRTTTYRMPLFRRPSPRIPIRESFNLL